ncbi:MAG: DNA repair protein RadC [Bacilli bacterium]|nr:DNA repair protein RadC [Bacilli bacterium]MDD4733814.1 DNA repair protein RadC [Bacilli bacterium]
MKIKDLPLEERPRERLINYGVDSLSNEELIAILLKTGTVNNSAKSLAQNVLKNIDNINNVRINNLISIKGIGISKACTIIASLELGKRLNNKVLTLKNKFNNPKIIFEYYQTRLKDIKQEHFYAIYLDSKNKIIDDKLLFIGTINASLVHPRDIFKEAYLLNATSIICIHNHPSGNPIPSKEDMLLTKNLTKIGLLMGIKMIDHIIIGENNYYSFYENKDIS